MPTTGVLLLAGAWILREVGGILLKRAAARSGAVGYRKRAYGFYCIARTEDGRDIESQFFPKNMFLEEQTLSLRCSGDLYNDSDIQLLLTHPQVVFLHPTGPQVVHSTPDLRAEGKQVAVVTVPAHGTAAIDLFLSIRREDLDDKYAHTIPVLVMRAPDGREFEFRLGSTEFAGDLTVAWPRRGKRPIFLHRKRGKRLSDNRPSDSP